MQSIIDEIKTKISYDCSTELKVCFFSVKEFSQVLHTENIMGIIEYGKKREFWYDESFLFPYIFVEIDVEEDRNYVEVWFTDTEPEYFSYNDLMVSMNGNDFFVGVSEKINHENVSFVSEAIYNNIFNISESMNLVIHKIWNYIPSILNEDQQDINIYKKFCYGRAESFANHGSAYPAATGIGCKGKSVVVYFVAAIQRNCQGIENHRQTPAYRYPQKYGKKSPSFARATCILEAEAIRRVYISGTASILKSKTEFVNDLIKQLDTAIKNIQALISATNLSKYGLKQEFDVKELECIKVYVKNKDSLSVVKKMCMKTFNASNIIYFITDICRDDLLVEIEGIVFK